MKILLISFHFPPENTIGAVRVGKLAKYLVENGHDVRVLTREYVQPATTLPVEIDESFIIRTKWFDINSIPSLFFGGRKQVKQVGYKTTSNFVKKIGNLYQSLLNYPDEAIGWYPYAIKKGRALIQNWKPQVIYASAPPVTSLMAANRLHKKFHIPWIAELRDLWLDNPNYSYGKIRKFFERSMERSTLNTSHAMVTVSEYWADVLAKKFGKIVHVTRNGFDPDDFIPLKHEPDTSDDLIIAFPGTYYEKFHDIEPLVIAIKHLSEQNHLVHVHLYMKYYSAISSLVKKHGVEANFIFHERVSYQDALKIQKNADVLLLMLWGDSARVKERGVIPAKLFEYIGVQRPILGIGLNSIIAAEIVNKEKLGIVSNDPGVIAEQIKAWITIKKQVGYIPDLSAKLNSGYTRNEQHKNLVDFLLQNVQ